MFGVEMSEVEIFEDEVTEVNLYEVISFLCHYAKPKVFLLKCSRQSKPNEMSTHCLN